MSISNKQETALFAGMIVVLVFAEVTMEDVTASSMQ